jgi:hypothetical protein
VEPMKPEVNGRDMSDDPLPCHPSFTKCCPIRTFDITVEWYVSQTIGVVRIGLEGFTSEGRHMAE